MKISLYVQILPQREIPFLEEWVNHNLNLGIDKIYIYNNGSKKIYGKSYSEFKFTYEESISKLSDIEHKYSEVKVHSWIPTIDQEFCVESNDPHHCNQVFGFKHCAENNHSDYYLHCDPDEYFVLPIHKTFKNLISDEEYKGVGAFWFGPEFYEPRVNNKSINELKTSGIYKRPVGSWVHTKCMSKSLVKTPIKWAYKYDSIIHKNRSFKGISKHINKDIGYFKHYTTTRI